MLHKITNWDDAYDNGNNIPFGNRWPSVWADASTSFRSNLPAGSSLLRDIPYGEDVRQCYDLIAPTGETKGLVIFIHGGFWFKLDKNYFTHLSYGSVINGWSFALPSYRLCPNVRISEITKDMAEMIERAAEQTSGPIRLIGHSAGGQLVSMMTSKASPLSEKTRSRIAKIVSVSGLHDLQPLMNLKMNDILRIDAEEAIRQSPIQFEPTEGTNITCWVGADERPEFIRQNDLLMNAWGNSGAVVGTVHQEQRHHFNILDDLIDPASDIVNELLG